MAGMFRKAVHEVVEAGLRGLSQPLRGMIPQGGIENQSWTCTVQIPNPKGGAHPVVPASGGTNYLVYHGVPLPKNADGVIQAILNLVTKAPRAVMVGFKGANLSFPYIINFEGFVHEVTDKPAESVLTRNPGTPQKFTTVATPGLWAPLPAGVAGPPIPLAGPPLPPAGAAVAKVAAQASESGISAATNFAGVLNRLTQVLVKNP